MAVIIGCAENVKYNALTRSGGGLHGHQFAAAERVQAGIELPPGTALSREEELWVIQRAEAPQAGGSARNDERPGSGALLANIEPGKRIDINIKYFHTLSYDDGWYEFVFPMVVGPRFNPPGKTDGIGAVGVGSRGASGQGTEIQYLRPDQRSGHDIALSVKLDAGVRVESILCRSHDVIVKAAEKRQATVTLSERDRIPNRDFVLRYKVAGEAPKSVVLTHRDERGGYFALMLVPPADLSRLERRPLEMVFTLDVSGSMSGRPIEQAVSAMRYALAHMDWRDTFQVITFSDRAHKLFGSPRPATRANIKEALSFINSRRRGGGTMMIEGIRASLDFPHDESRLRFVSFLTDGYIGNEREILGEIHKCLGPSRIFSFGVGSSVNRYLLDHMAKMGRGAVAYLSLKDDAEEVMGAFFERIAHPAMTDISIDWGEMNVTEVYPQRIPDLFVGRPVIVTGRFTGRSDSGIRIKGIVGDQVREIRVPVDGDEPNAARRALAAIWARGKIADLADRSTWDAQPELPQQIKQVALEYGLMSPYTAFVAVDSMTRTAGDHGVTVSVPVPVPDGVEYETTVQERRGH